MADALRDRRFATYLAVSCLVLIALAAAGPGAFLIGMSAIVVAELASHMTANDVRTDLRSLGV